MNFRGVFPLVLAVAVAVVGLAFALIIALSYLSGPVDDISCLTAQSKVSLVDSPYLCYNDDEHESSFSVAIDGDVDGVVVSFDDGSDVVSVDKTQGSSSIRGLNGAFGDPFSFKSGQINTYVYKGKSARSVSISPVIKGKTCSVSDFKVLEPCSDEASSSVNIGESNSGSGGGGGGGGSSGGSSASGNQIPIAYFIANQTSGEPPLNVMFNASLSSDPDGTIVLYSWNFGDGNVTDTTNDSIEHKFISDGSYNVILSVTDNGGASDAVSLNIEVSALTSGQSLCGDGIIDSSEGETCDDGNGFGGDGCSSTCTVESGWECTGEPSDCSPTSNELDTFINASRSICVAPCGIYFDQPNAFEHEYNWDFGDGNVQDGFQAAHIYEQPGTYTVTLSETNHASGQIGQDTKQIDVLSFSGLTYYIDSASGSDANDGISPASAWKSLNKTWSVSANANTKILLKRGQIFYTGVNDSVGINLYGIAGPLFIGAYANPDGSDNAILPKPVIQENPARYNSSDPLWWRDVKGYQLQKLIGGNFVNETYISDIQLKGNYDYGDSDFCNQCNSADGIDVLNGLYGGEFIYRGPVVINRVEIDHLLFGILGQADAVTLGMMVHNSYIHHIESTPIFGDFKGYSVQNTTIDHSSQSHLQYVAAENAVVRDSIFNWSGVVPGSNWSQCGIRFDSVFENQPIYPRRILISTNRVSEASGATLCLGENPRTKYPLSDVLVERNVFDGNTTETNLPYYRDVQTPMVSLGSVYHVLFRNNLIFNVGKSIGVDIGTAIHCADAGCNSYVYNYTSNNLVFVNNIFYNNGGDTSGDIWAGGRDFIRFYTSLTSETRNYIVKNNIFAGKFNTALYDYGDANFSYPNLDVDNNLYYKTDGSGLFISKYIGVLYNFTQWQSSFGFDSNSFIDDPQFISVNSGDSDFLVSEADGPVSDSGSNLSYVYNDFFGVARPQGNAYDIGAFEIAGAGRPLGSELSCGNRITCLIDGLKSPDSRWARLSGYATNSANLSGGESPASIVLYMLSVIMFAMGLIILVDYIRG